MEANWKKWQDNVHHRDLIIHQGSKAKDNWQTTIIEGFLNYFHSYEFFIKGVVLAIATPYTFFSRKAITIMRLGDKLQ